MTKRKHRRRGPVEWPPVPCMVCGRTVAAAEDAALVGGEGTGEWDVVHRAICFEVVASVMGGVRRHEPIVDFLDRIEGAA